MCLRSLFATICSAAIIVVVAPSAAVAQNYCTAANPNDGVADDAALQSCLNGGGTILLSAGSAGSPGYILSQGLRLNVSGTVLSSANQNNRARIVAAAGLNEFMLRGDANNYEISFLIFDGNRNSRTNACNYPNGHNLLLYGSGFVVRFSDSFAARCGSALEMNGSYYEVYNNTIAFNGFSIDERASEYADGITVHRCTGGTIRNNQVAENTDIGIVVNESAGCTIRWNSIWNNQRYAFAGMHISAGASGGDHSGSVFADNTISGGYNYMGYGLMVGAYPWHFTRTANVGTVEANGISGAVINMAVDAVDGGIIVSNSMTSAQGTRGYYLCNGTYPDNFTAWNNGGGLSLQAGWVPRQCH